MLLSMEKVLICLLLLDIISFMFQTAAELEKRKENFTKELDFVFADVVCLLLCDETFINL